LHAEGVRLRLGLEHDERAVLQDAGLVLGRFEPPEDAVLGRLVGGQPEDGQAPQHDAIGTFRHDGLCSGYGAAAASPPRKPPLVIPAPTTADKVRPVVPGLPKLPLLPAAPASVALACPAAAAVAHDRLDGQTDCGNSCKACDV